MGISRGLQILTIALAISCIWATPLKRSKSKSARQVEFTTPSSVVEEKTGYPEAGFRPRIPFDLPTDVMPKAVTESVEFITTTMLPTTTPESALEDFDEIVPTTVLPEVFDHTPADTYGAPAVSGDDTEEVDAEVVPAPAEDFQPPSEDAFQDFEAAFNVINNNDGNVIVDLPAAEQTSEMEDLDIIVTSKQIPADTYGAPDFVNVPKTDVETVEQEVELEQVPQNDIEGQDEVQDLEVDVEQQQEGSAEIEIDLNSESQFRTQEPADTYGAPKTEFEEDNEVESELAEVEQQLEILSRLTQLKTGRLVILPIQKNLYLGRLVSGKPKRNQRQNGRLLKL